MTVVRYTPSRSYLSMQDTMNSLVNALFNSADFADSNTNKNEISPRADMKEYGDKFVIQMSMPGVDINKIDISVTEDILTVRAVAFEGADAETDEDCKWVIREQSEIAYLRSIQLPSQVIADQADAQYKNGILLLTLPKAEEKKPKTISVRIAE